MPSTDTAGFPEAARRTADYDQWLAEQKGILAALTAGYRALRRQDHSQMQATAALLLSMYQHHTEAEVRALIAAAITIAAGEPEPGQDAGHRPGH